MKEGGGEGNPFFPTPSPLTRVIFHAVLARKQHGNACYAGYTYSKGAAFFDIFLLKGVLIQGGTLI